MIILSYKRVIGIVKLCFIDVINKSIMIGKGIRYRFESK